MASTMEPRFFTASPASQWHSSLSHPATPVQLHDRVYPSASAALDAYIQVHDGKLPPEPSHLNRTVEDLLLPKSCLELTTRQARPTQDILLEQRLSRLKHLVDDSYQRLERQDSGHADLSASAILSQRLQTPTRTPQHVATNGLGCTPIDGLIAPSHHVLATNPMDLASCVHTPKVQPNSLPKPFVHNLDLSHGMLSTNGIDLMSNPQPRGDVKGYPITQRYRDLVQSTPNVPSRTPIAARTFTDASCAPSPILAGKAGDFSVVGPELNVSDLRQGTPMRDNKHISFDPKISSIRPNEATRHSNEITSIREEESQNRHNSRYIDLDKASLTTDDLLLAAPGGHNVSTRLRSQERKLETIPHSPRQTDFVPASRNFSKTESGLINWREIAGTSFASRSGAKSNNSEDVNTARRRAFVDNLVHEVDCSASSVVTENPYLFQIRKQDKTPYGEQSSNRWTREVSPETDELLVEPPMPNLNISPTLTSSEGHTNGKPQSDFMVTLQKLLAEPTAPNDLTLSPHRPDTSRSPDTENILDGDRSWEKTNIHFKAPRYIGKADSPSKSSHHPKKSALVEKFLEECLEEPKRVPSPTLTGHDQPGTLEALKNMLFTVQTMGSDDADNSSPTIVTDKNRLSPDVLCVGAPHIPVKTPDSTKRNQSLDRAMVHLDRLKSLIKKDKENDMEDGS